MNFFKRAAKATATMNAYRRVFSTEDGKIVLNDLMKACFIMRSTVGNSSDETSYNEGQRNVVLRILETCKMTSTEVEKVYEYMKQTEQELDG